MKLYYKFPIQERKMAIKWPSISLFKNVDKNCNENEVIKIKFLASLNK